MAKENYLHTVLHEAVISGDGFEKEKAQFSDIDPIDAACLVESSGLNAAHLIERAETMSAAMSRNIDIASRMRTEPSDVRSRTLWLSLIGIIGVIAAISAITYAWLSPPIEEQGRGLLLLVLVGGIGLFLCSTLAALYVLWNAFAHEALLKEAARGDTLQIVRLIQTVSQSHRGTTVEQLRVFLKQHSTWAKYST